MKIAEIKEIPTNDLVERVEAEVTNYNQMVLNHSISPLDNPAQIQQIRTDIAGHESPFLPIPAFPYHLPYHIYS